MKLATFNASLLVGWLLVLAGGVLINPGYGLVAAGLLLIAIVVYVSHYAGVYATPAANRAP